MDNGGDAGILFCTGNVTSDKMLTIDDHTGLVTVGMSHKKGQVLNALLTAFHVAHMKAARDLSTKQSAEDFLLLSEDDRRVARLLNCDVFEYLKSMRTSAKRIKDETDVMTEIDKRGLNNIVDQIEKLPSSVKSLLPFNLKELLRHKGERVLGVQRGAEAGAAPKKRKVPAEAETGPNKKQKQQLQAASSKSTPFCSLLPNAVLFPPA